MTSPINDSETQLTALLESGDVLSGYRSRALAERLLPAVRNGFGIDVGKTANVDAFLISYITDVLLSASWYVKKYKKARINAILYVALNIFVILFIPLAIALLGQFFSGRSGYESIISQLTTVLTGIFALQKTVSAWYSQQQNYAGWYKCSADLKENYYSLVKKWANHVPGRENEFAQELQDGEASARRIMDAERIDYYTRLALPSFDVLDMLTSSRATVTSLVTTLVPAARPATAVAIGTKAILGSTADGSAPLKTAAADVNDVTYSSAAQPSLFQTASLVTSRRFPEFDQDVVDACAAISINDASDLAKIYPDRSSFFDWYNATFRSVTDVASRYPCSDTVLKRSRFDAFWNQIPVIYGRNPVSAIDFCALMAVNLEESAGDLSAAPEGMNGMGRPHPGLAYAFDRIPGAKQSYNHKPNRTALALFQDPDYVVAHGGRPGKDLVMVQGHVDPRWGGDVWPSNVPANVDAGRNGYIMQADFYKFRGRGVIQTTWRDDYQKLIGWILSADASSNAVLKGIADEWAAAVAQVAGDPVEAIATVSTNEDWDAVFGQPITLAKGVAIDSNAKGKYLDNLARSADVLDGAKETAGSFLNFAHHINGGDYPERVAPIMKALMCGIAETVGGVGSARQPRALDA